MNLHGIKFATWLNLPPHVAVQIHEQKIQIRSNKTGFLAVEMWLGSSEIVSVEFFAEAPQIRQNFASLSPYESLNYRPLYSGQWHSMPPTLTYRAKDFKQNLQQTIQFIAEYY